MRRVIIGMLMLFTLGCLHTVVAPPPAAAACSNTADPCCDTLRQTDNPDGSVSIDYGDPRCDPNYRPSRVWLGIATIVILGGLAFVSYQVVQSRRERVS